MLYNVEVKGAVLDTLENRVSSIALIICNLLEEGYIPNKAKLSKIQIGLMLIDAFENADVFSEEQHKKLENLYNKFELL
jgi:hypothetical protein